MFRESCGICRESFQERERGILREFYDERESNVSYLIFRESCGICRESLQERERRVFRQTDEIFGGGVLRREGKECFQNITLLFHRVLLQKSCFIGLFCSDRVLQREGKECFGSLTEY